MSQYVADKRLIEHDRPLSSGSSGIVGQSDPPQFTLGGLFIFLTAIAVCLSLAVSGAGMEPDLGVPLLASAVVLFWIVLSVTYRKLRLRGTLICHCLVPALLAGFMLVYLTVVLAAGASDFFESAAVLIDTVRHFLLALLSVTVVGCLLGSLLSVIVFIAAMLVAIDRAFTDRSA